MDDLKFWILAELSETPLWEAFWEAPEHPAAVERALREIHAEGFATFGRRPLGTVDRPIEAELEPLSDAEISAAIGDVGLRDPTTLDVGVWMVPTPKWHRWRDEEARKAFGPEPPDHGY